MSGLAVMSCSVTVWPSLALVVGRLLGDQLDRVSCRGRLGLEDLLEAGVAVVGDVDARGAEQDRQVAVATGLADHRLRRPPALLHEVRADPADVGVAERRLMVRKRSMVMIGTPCSVA